MSDDGKGAMADGVEGVPAGEAADAAPHDEWAWLRAERWRACMKDPRKLPARIRKHLEAENARADAWFEDLAPLRKTLLAEMRGRIEPDDDSLPDHDGPWSYFSRVREDEEYGAYFRRPRDGGASGATGEGADETLLLDLEAEADGHDYFDEGDVDHSPDHARLAWSVDVAGAELYELRVRDLATGHDTVSIPETHEMTWAGPDTLFYTRVDENHRPSRVFRHRLGTDPATDALVFEETDERFSVSVGTTRSGDWVVIETSMTDCDEVRLIPTADPGADPVVVEPRTPGLEYSIEHQRERFLILANADGAPDFQLMEAPVATPSRAHWRTLLPHEPGRVLLDVDALGDWTILTVRENALPRIELHHRDGRMRALEFDEAAYALGVDAGLEFDAEVFRFSYTSPTTPEREYEEHLETGERRLLKSRTIPSGHDPADYAVRRITLASHDGAQVPVTLLSRADAGDAPAPTLLYGYGAYGMSTPASFSGRTLSLVDRGVSFAIAHVRGGRELGRAWYEAGRLEAKANSFEDLYAVATGLVAEGIAERGRICLQGGSAGGLLVGATLELAARRDPGLLAGVVADVPFVDVLNTMSDASLPLTPGEWSEWGDPITDPEARRRLASWSPYDTVGARDYPPLYVTAGVSDPRVTWWEPAKWVARIRERRTNEAPLLLRTNMSSGHFGDTGRYASLEDAAREQAFVLRVVGLA